MIPDKIIKYNVYAYQKRPYIGWAIDNKLISWKYVITEDFEGNNILDRVEVWITQRTPHWWGNSEKVVWSDTLG